ncbi:unnamed protein product [Protopolystoma xenopodis]|uniref:Uncharacterized protein n=1 Tax=Protopolystoma xenopodis TaxID=117903 RepID=A0A3S5CK84_9PLAT|nr:unnamed protein product [Protopolystoma xenopodis]
MDSGIKKIDIEVETSPETVLSSKNKPKKLTSRKEEDEEEEEEEEEEDKIIEKSHNGRFQKRNKRFPKQIAGVDNAFVAIEPKSGKEVIWNESILPEKKTDKEIAVWTPADDSLPLHGYEKVQRMLSKIENEEQLTAMTNDDATAPDHPAFAILLKDYFSHLEDETVIVDVHYKHDDLTNSRSWKDFRSNFTLTPKYLEDVK